MNEDLHLKCRSAILEDPSVLQQAKDHIELLTAVELKTFDQSYIDFLSEQIELCPRGLEWNEIIKKRKIDLEAHVDHELIDCRIETGFQTYTFKIDPTHRKVIHWESYESEI